MIAAGHPDDCRVRRSRARPSACWTGVLHLIATRARAVTLVSAAIIAVVVRDREHGDPAHGRRVGPVRRPLVGEPAREPRGRAEDRRRGRPRRARARHGRPGRRRARAGSDRSRSRGREDGRRRQRRRARVPPGAQAATRRRRPPTGSRRRSPAIRRCASAAALIASRQVTEAIQSDLRRAELIAFPLVLLLSFWVFRGLVAAFLPPLVGAGAIALTFLGLRIAVEVHSALGLRAQPRHRPRARPRDRLLALHRLALARGGRPPRARARGARRDDAHRRPHRLLQRPHRRGLDGLPARLPAAVPLLDGARRRPRRARGRARRARAAAGVPLLARAADRRARTAPAAAGALGRALGAPRGVGDAAAGAGRRAVRVRAGRAGAAGARRPLRRRRRDDAARRRRARGRSPRRSTATGIRGRYAPITAITDGAASARTATARLAAAPGRRGGPAGPADRARPLAARPPAAREGARRPDAAARPHGAGRAARRRASPGRPRASSTSRRRSAAHLPWALAILAAHDVHADLPLHRLGRPAR